MKPTYLLVAIACMACGNDQEQRGVPPAKLFRLTSLQYANTVRGLFGDDIVVPAIEPDIKLHGFTSIASGELTVSPLALDLYEAAAHDLARQVIEDPARRARVVGCDEPLEPCIDDFFARFGRRAWRRPLAREELAGIAAVVEQAASALGGDRWTAVEYGIAAVLQAPHFLYRVELGTGRLGSYEMASRLAFVLTDSGPDDALLDAAHAGELDTSEGVRRHAARLIDEPRGRAALGHFFAEYMNLERIADASKNLRVYPQMTEPLREAMRREIEALFTHVVFDLDDDYRRIFTTDQAFVMNAELAELYEVEPPRPDEALPAVRTLPADSPRRGLLGTAGVFAIYTESVDSSPTRSGRFVRQNLLCEDIPPPPPNVDTSFGTNTGATVRERLEIHRENPACAGCHALMDPIGLGFERFDAIGRIRSEEAPGVPVDDVGDLDGVAFTGVRGLGELLETDPRVGPCFVTQLYRHMTGHLETPTEQRGLDELAASFATRGYRVRDLVIELAASDAFRHVEAP